MSLGFGSVALTSFPVLSLAVVLVLVHDPAILGAEIFKSLLPSQGAIDFYQWSKVSISLFFSHRIKLLFHRGDGKTWVWVEFQQWLPLSPSCHYGFSQDFPQLSLLSVWRGFCSKTCKQLWTTLSLWLPGSSHTLTSSHSTFSNSLKINQIFLSTYLEVAGFAPGKQMLGFISLCRCLFLPRFCLDVCPVTSVL